MVYMIERFSEVIKYPRTSFLFSNASAISSFCVNNAVSVDLHFWNTNCGLERLVFIKKASKPCINYFLLCLCGLCLWLVFIKKANKPCINYFLKAFRRYG